MTRELSNSSWVILQVLMLQSRFRGLEQEDLILWAFDSFTGLNLPNLQTFNVSINCIVAGLLKTLSAFLMSAFDRNAVLCGSPMPACKNVAGGPTKPGFEGAIASSMIPSGNLAILAFLPSSISISAMPTQPQNTHHSAIGKISLVAMTAIILGDILVPNKSLLLPLN